MSMSPKHTNTSQLSNYINQRFNPKLLPALILHLLSYHSDARNIVSCNSQNKASKNKVVGQCLIQVTNNPTISLLFTNMKLYDAGIIKKQNCVLQAAQIDKLFKTQSKQDKVQKGQQTPLKQISQNIHQTNLNHNFKQKQKHNSFISHLENLYRSFSIFEYRINDLTLFIVALNQIASKSTEISTKTVINKIVIELEELCSKIHTKLQHVKQELESIYQQISKNQQKQQNVDKLTHACSSDQYKKMLLDKLKQINEKYTNISKKIFARQNKYRQLNQRQKKFRLQLMTEASSNTKNNLTAELHDKIKQNSIRSFQSNSKNQLNSYRKDSNKNVSYRSILKNKLSMKGKSKRISIQIITNMLEAERNRKKGESKEGNKFSRFRHRNGVNIGSGTVINKKNEVGKIKMKKQVKIQMGLTDRKQADQNLDVQQRKSNKLKRGFSLSKNSKNSKIAIFQDLCQRAEDDPDNESNYSRRRNKQFFSCREIHSFHSSRHSVISKSSISRSQSKSKSLVKGNNRKRSRKNTYCYSRPVKSYASCRNFKPKSSKNIKIGPINQSLKNILDEAVRKKKAGLLANRNGRIITDIDNSDQQINEKPEHFKRKNMRMKSNKYKFNRVNYNNVLQALHNQQKDKSNQSHSKPINSTMKDTNQSMRRLGIEIVSTVADPIRTSGNIDGSHKDSRVKQKSQNLSVSSSKRYHLSNNKITDRQANDLMKRQTRGAKIKTQASQFLQAPAQFRVSLEQKPSILQNYIKFYQNVQCTLYQSTKKYNRDQLLNGHAGEENRMLQLLPMSNFYVKKFVHQQNSQLEAMQRVAKLQMFEQEGAKLMLSKRIVTAANELKQTDFI